MRKEFEMTDQDLEELMDASKPVPLIALNCGMPDSPQENANRAWKRLGEKMKFDHMTVQHVEGKGNKAFTAETDYMDCNTCGLSFDMRDLEQVSFHESCDKSIGEIMTDMKKLIDDFPN